MSKQGKFHGVDFSTAEVVQWTPDLAHLGPGFRCNRKEFIDFWKVGRIARECETHIGRCWVIHHNEHLAGYITLLTDKLTLRRQLLKTEGVRYTTFPAVKVGLLAADPRAKGAGKRLMRWAMAYSAAVLSQRVGVRFMTVDAFFDPDTDYNIAGFYQNLGFTFSHPNGKPRLNQTYREMYADLGWLINLYHPPKSKES